MRAASEVQGIDIDEVLGELWSGPSEDVSSQSASDTSMERSHSSDLTDE